MAPTPPPGAPQVSSADTIDAIVKASKRTSDFPLRRGFVQGGVPGEPLPGAISPLVRAGDLRALQLYLMLVTKASSAPWDAALPATVWARALGLALPDTKTARSTVSKVWLRLERHGLVERVRRGRLADVYLLREDGSRVPYTSPGADGDRYFKVPLALWLDGPDETSRWYQTLTLPELVIVLVGRSLGDEFWLPYEKGPEWYGISADTVTRGVAGLRDLGLIEVDQRFKPAPLSAVGYTAEHRYTLLAPFGPVGRRSGMRSSTTSTNPSSRVRIVKKASAGGTARAGQAAGSKRKSPVDGRKRKTAKKQS